jgi:AraC-like DNA-binding protein
VIVDACYPPICALSWKGRTSVNGLSAPLCRFLQRAVAIPTLINAVIRLTHGSCAAILRKTAWFPEGATCGDARDQDGIGMKPIYEKLIGYPDEGFIVKEIRGDACNCRWHCHVEIELVCVLQSHGYRIVGDQIHSLQPGDLVLLGPNLPHAYQHTDRLSPKGKPAHCLLLQFEESLWLPMFNLPAMNAVRGLLERAGSGLHVTGPTRKRIAAMLQEMLKLHGIPRITAFLTLLNTLAQSRSCTTIASRGFQASLSSYEQERIGRVCQFIDENFHQPLRLLEVAKLCHMSEGAFSRFFRSHMGKTFPAFVNDLRIGRACRLLAETEMNMTEVALSCGFQNISNFNRRFLQLKKASPTEFRRRLRCHG